MLLFKKLCEEAVRYYAVQVRVLRRAFRLRPAPEAFVEHLHHFFLELGDAVESQREKVAEKIFRRVLQISFDDLVDRERERLVQLRFVEERDCVLLLQIAHFLGQSVALVDDFGSALGLVQVDVAA